MICTPNRTQLHKNLEQPPWPIKKNTTAMPKTTRHHSSQSYQSFIKRQKKVLPDYSYLVMERVEEDTENSCNKHLPSKGRWFSIEWSNKKDSLGEREFINCVESKRRFIKHQQTCDLYERRARNTQRALLRLVGDSSKDAIEKGHQLKIKLASLESTIEKCYDYCCCADLEHCTAQQVLLDVTGHDYVKLKNVDKYENL